MNKSDKKEIHRAINELYLDRVTEKAAMKYLAEKEMNKREMNRINIETAYIALSVAAVFALIWIGVK